MSWSNTLEVYAKAKDPARELKGDVYLTSDEHTVTIFDGYPKAKYHFLTMPRVPFRLPDDQTVPPASLLTLSALLKSPHAKLVLQSLKIASDKIKTMIEDEMLKDEGWIWPIRIGFHAVESMRQVHLHIISSDLINDRLKNKKHYNSFHPELGFFLYLDDILAELETGSTSYSRTSAATYEMILKEPLVSFYNGDEFKTIPKLKDHLESEWKKSRETSSATKASPSVDKKRKISEDVLPSSKKI